MKKMKIAAAALACWLLCGCTEIADERSGGTQHADTSSADSTGNADSTGGADNSTAADAETEPLTPTSMPVLSIVTKDQSEDILRFVTEPVSEFVARSIASWTPGYIMPPAPYYEACEITLKDTDNTVLLDAADAKVKVRGNWTTSYDKKPLRIKFEKKQNLLGLNGGAEMKNWVLLAGYKDGSLLRDKTALSVARELLGADGLYAADAQFVEVEINGQYWGVYLLTELQQVNPNRIAITEAEPEYSGTDIGYFMEFDGYFSNEEPLRQFYVDYAENAPLIPFDGNDGSGRTITCLSEGDFDYKKDIGITIKSDITSQEQHDFIEAYVNNVYRILYEAVYNGTAYQFDADYTSVTQTADMTPQQAVEAAVNVQSLADMYILSELTCDADIYWSSFFMDVDFGAEGDRRLTFEAPWDFDSSMGNKDRCADASGFYAANIVPDVDDAYETVNPWLAVLMYEDWFQEIIAETWTNAYDSCVFSRGIAMIASDTEQYADAFARNEQRWQNIADNSAYGHELSGGAESCKTHGECAAYLADWLTARVEFLNSYWHK